MVVLVDDKKMVNNNKGEVLDGADSLSDKLSFVKIGDDTKKQASDITWSTATTTSTSWSAPPVVVAEEEDNEFNSAQDEMMKRAQALRKKKEAEK